MHWTNGNAGRRLSLFVFQIESSLPENVHWHFGCGRDSQGIDSELALRNNFLCHSLKPREDTYSPIEVNCKVNLPSGK